MTKPAGAGIGSAPERIRTSDLGFRSRRASFTRKARNSRAPVAGMCWRVNRGRGQEDSTRRGRRPQLIKRIAQRLVDPWLSRSLHDPERIGQVRPEQEAEFDTKV